LPALFSISDGQLLWQGDSAAFDRGWAKSQITFFRIQITVKFGVEWVLGFVCLPNQENSGLNGNYIET
jgi:hypothetical protein